MAGPNDSSSRLPLQRIQQDLNGDGIRDGRKGNIVLFANSDGTFPSSLGSNNENGFFISTSQSGQFQIQRLPDLNGDGLRDFRIGNSVVFAGSNIPGAISPSENLNFDLDGENGFFISTSQSGQFEAQSLPDLNLDDIKDFRIGNSVVFAGTDLPSEISPSENLGLNGENGFLIRTQRFPSPTISGVPDLNDDGIDDIRILDAGFFRGEDIGAGGSVNVDEPSA